MKIKIIQSYPISYKKTLYQTGQEVEVDDTTAKRLIAENRVMAVEEKSLAQKETLKQAIAEMLEQAPDTVPAVAAIKDKTGISIKAADRDALIAEIKEQSEA